MCTYIVSVTRAGIGNITINTDTQLSCSPVACGLVMEKEVSKIILVMHA